MADEALQLVRALQELQLLRRRVLSLAIQFEHAARRGDELGEKFEIEGALTEAEQLESDSADLDYNARKAELFVAVRALVAEAQRLDATPA